MSKCKQEDYCVGDCGAWCTGFNADIPNENYERRITKVDSALIVRGKWVEDGAYQYVCSACKIVAEFGYNYCPNCGAKMEFR